MNVRLLERLLERAGYRHLQGTTDPRCVLDLYRSFQPDLILLDLLMPDLDGVAVLEQLGAEIPATAYLPVLVLTVDATREAKRRALAAGARDFLTKPFEPFEELLRIRNLLDTRRLHLTLERQMVEVARQRADAVAGRLTTEEALRESEERTELIVAHALDAVITIDVQGRITSWNPQAERLFGWSQGEIVGRLLSETIIPPAYREAHERGWAHFRATGEGPVLNRRIELTGCTATGPSFRWSSRSPRCGLAEPWPSVRSCATSAIGHEATKRCARAKPAFVSRSSGTTRR